MFPGCMKVIQSQVREVGVGPALMIFATSSAFALVSFAHNAAQSHAYPSVDGPERGLVAVLVVFEPSFKDRVEFADDTAHARPIGPFRSCPNLLA